MSCEYCGKEKELLDTNEIGNGVLLSIQGNKLVGGAYYDCGYFSAGSDITINYCPMCGRKLEEEIK